MIVFDTETTGLLESGNENPDFQPEIIEFAAVKLDSDLNIIDRIEFFCKPKKEITAEITKITGITSDMVKDAKPFQAHYMDLCKFFFGETTLVAHNATFDVDILFFALKRIGKEKNFPWPYIHECTVEMSEGRKSRKLGDLYLEEFGNPIDGAHRAMRDVVALVHYYRRLMNPSYEMID